MHIWLPNAYAHAPHMVTVFLAACGTKVAVYVLFRFNFFVFQENLPEHPVQFAFFLMPLALLGAVIASGVAMFEGHLKRLLAFSSVAQISYILIGASLLSTEGLTASIIHIFNHALAKSALFLAIASLAIRYHDLRVDEIAGAARTMPWTCAAFVVAGLSLIGIPGTAGFISKWLLVLAAMDHGRFGILLVSVILLTSLMAVYYIWRIVEKLYFPASLAAASHPEKRPCS
ncbi:MAG: proton-conducting transporter membrane subunit [Gammaproteobacteria bacterium]|nr:proton-conducting transporter membrane subunit [Gammaproteobacteria bacterium]